MTSTPAARAFLIFTAAIVGTAVLVVVLLFGTVGNTEKTVQQSETNFDVLKDAETILRIILAVTGCTEQDTEQQCRDRVAASSTRSVVELDCRVRLAIAGQPAPKTGETCVPPPPTTTTTTTVPALPPIIDPIPPPP